MKSKTEIENTLVQRQEAFEEIEEGVERLENALTVKKEVLQDMRTSIETIEWILS